MPKGKSTKQAGHFAVLRGTLADDRPGFRNCLGGCGKTFWSKGPANRMCPACSKVNRERALSRHD